MLATNTPTATTIVNAAFLQDVKDANPRLWELLREMRELAMGEQERAVLAHRFVEGVDELRESLALQFSLEETYGFIDGSTLAPRSGSARAGLAKAQHRELYLQIHELDEQVEEAEYRGTICRDLPGLMDSFQDFDQALSAHEALESELIRRALGA